MEKQKHGEKGDWVADVERKLKEEVEWCVKHGYLEDERRRK